MGERPADQARGVPALRDAPTGLAGVCLSDAGLDEGAQADLFGKPQSSVVLREREWAE